MTRYGYEIRIFDLNPPASSRGKMKHFPNISVFKNRPDCLFIRTFFPEEFIYPLTYVKMLETVCIPPLTSLICEIKTRLILWKYQVILVIEYIYWSNVLTERFSILYKNQTK